MRVGYNHRFHPALAKAREMVNAGAVGPLMFIRARYGHGGRVGYDREWRADPELSGGGELIDQGVHLIDLAGWFLGEFTSVEGHAATYFWNMPVDDNAFLNLRNADGATAWLQVSCSEWKNLFSFEIYGRDGKLQVDGLGGSYGLESLTYYRMLPRNGAAGDDALGVSARRRFVAAGDGGVFGGHPVGADARAGATGGAEGTGGRGGRVPPERVSGALGAGVSASGRLRPFRARKWVIVSQGVALGYRIVPLRGEEWGVRRRDRWGDWYFLRQGRHLAGSSRRVTVKVLPRSWPGLAAASLPPWASTMACEIARPSPRPPKRWVMS